MNKKFSLLKLLLSHINSDLFQKVKLEFKKYLLHLSLLYIC